MGKNRHSKDRLFITATEWAVEYGGKKNREKSAGDLARPLPFDHCALSLAPYTNPVILLSRSTPTSSSSSEPPKSESTGVIFDFENIVPFLQQYKSDPVSGEPMTTKSILRLNMHKNIEDKWHCPVTCKVFTNNSHVVAIAKTGNVFSYDAVLELNIKPKNFTDLLTGEAFKKSELITLQDPHNKSQMMIRDVGNFLHLKKLRDENIEARKVDSKLRHNPVSEDVMKEIGALRQAEAASGAKKRSIDHLMTSSSTLQLELDEKLNADVAACLALQPLIEDVNPGQVNTDGKASSSFTSSSMGRSTSNATRLATADEIRDAKWKLMRQIGKKAYVQLQTTMGNLNIELHCDIAMRTCWNFITLCNKGFYDGLTFHRLVPDFMIQTGDPTGTGCGGESAFSKAFNDEFDTRLSHSGRGIVSMANSGANSNTSQFFITFKDCKHLDLKHTVFGKVVGGIANLDKLEAVGADKKENPKQEIKIVKAVVFSSPVEETETALLNFTKGNIDKRLKMKKTAVLPSGPQETVTEENILNQLQKNKIARVN